MDPSRRLSRTLAALALLASVLGVDPCTAHAEPTLCQRALSSESAKYTRSVTQALQKCEDAKIIGMLPPGTVCSGEQGVMSAITNAQEKLSRKVAIRCGGDDHACGTPDDDTLVSIGWGAIGTCPGLKGAACSNAISNCGDISTCLACVGQAAASQTVALGYGSLNSAEFGTDSATNLCQRSLGQASTKFFLDRLKALQKCWDGRLRGKHANACPDPGDGKALARIAHAEESKQSRICRACGGADHQCGGGDDLTTGQVGFAATCRDETAPSDNTNCAAAVADMSGVVTCVDCAGTFGSDCVADLGVSALVPYPQACSPTPAPNFCPPPAVPAMLGSITFTASPGTTDCGGRGFAPPAAAPFAGEVDDGNGMKIADLGLGCLYSGSTAAAGIGLPDGFSSLLAITGSSGTSLSLGGSAGSGPADCSLGAGPARHCVNANPGAACTSDADCGSLATACAPDANCFFGPPTPVPMPDNPGLSICIMNVYASDACGVADLTAMTTTLAVSLTSRLYLTSDVVSPCPVCDSGTCSGGERAGLGCSGIGTRNTTLDCPPLSNQYLGALPVNLAPTTSGTATLTAPNGAFCPSQTKAGAFGLPAARLIKETGQALTPAGIGTFSTALAGTICIPSSGSSLVDGAVGLPAPGALSIRGTATISP